MFRRYFILWFTFFLTVLLSTGGVVVYSRWLSERDLQKVEAQTLTSFCLHQFLTQNKTFAHPERWDWKTYYRHWKADFRCLKGIALEDRADGRILVSYGDALPGTSMLAEDPGDQQFQWLTLPTGERLWAVLPAGKKNERYRLWLNFGEPTSFRDYVRKNGYGIAAVAGFLVLVFVLFYWRFGTPTKYLEPMVETIHRALERAESPLQVPVQDFPGEFVRMAKAVSLLLEARHEDYMRCVEHEKKMEHQKRQKEFIGRLMNKMQSTVEQEQSSVEKVQQILLNVNREPVIILDKTRRILAMNESARRTLSLSGQTGYQLRHSEIEEILNLELASDTLPTDHKISVRDPYFGRMTRWRVHVALHYHWEDPTQIQYIIVSLNEEESLQGMGTTSSEYLLRLIAGAWAETWSGDNTHPTPLSDAERKVVDNLARSLFTVGQRPMDVPSILEVFGLAGRGEFAPDVEFGIVSGGRDTWTAFGQWIHCLEQQMLRGRFRVELAGVTQNRLKLEWICESGIPFEDWFGEGEDKTRQFRRELLHKVSERLRIKITWHESAPNILVLEVLLKTRLVPPRQPYGVPLKV